MSDIVITYTIKEPGKTGRAIIVSAAPAGEMPLILTGQFADRHALLDRIFAELLKRKPKIVKHTKPEKSAEKDTPEEADPVTEAADEVLAEDQGEAAPADAKPDQLVRPEDLPVIEGDAPSSQPKADDEAQATLF